MQANSAVDRELKAEALEDLCARVDDWKNHRVDHFGHLLQHGHFPVVTGKSDVQKEVRPPLNFVQNISSFRNRATKDSKRKALSERSEKEDSRWDIVTLDISRDSSDDQPIAAEEDPNQFLANMIFHQSHGHHPITGDPLLASKFADEEGIICPHYEQYTIYLFERILLCCKDLNPNKSKDKLLGAQKDKKDKNKNKSKEPNKNAKLQLKGRIFMTNVTEVLSLAKQGMQRADPWAPHQLTIYRFLYCSDFLERGSWS